MKPFVYNSLKSISIFIVLLMTLECTSPVKSAMPDNIAGLKVGMSKSAAQKRLSEIADFERDEDKKQQIWKFKNDAHYSELAIGYNREDEVRYVTAFVDKESAKERIGFADIGDITKSRQEVIAPHYRYIWTINEPEPAYFLIVYGDDPKFLTSFALKLKTDESEEEEEGE